MPRHSSPELLKNVFDFLRQRADSVPPTVREIAEHCGIKSTSTVHSILGKLEEQGYIMRDAKSSRGITIKGMGKTSAVPIIGKITAGNPILAIEQTVGYIPYPIDAKDSDGLFALKVSGFSMRDAGILDNDIIIADKNKVAKEEDIVVALIDDEATVKTLRFDKETKKPYLQPENPEFSPIYADNIEILGKVIGSFRMY